MKTLIVLLAILFIEAGIIFVTIVLVGGPAEVRGQGLSADLDAEQNRIVEIQVLAERFANQRTGRTYLYDTEVFVTVRQRNAPRVKEDIEAMQAQISSDVATIFRRAEPAHFREPTLATLKRQVHAALDQRFGEDPEGERIVEDVFIPRCIEFRADR